MYVIEWQTTHGFPIYYKGVTHRSQKHTSVANYEEGSMIIHRTAVLHEAAMYDTIEKAKKELDGVIMDEAPMGEQLQFRPLVVEVDPKILFKSKLAYESKKE